MTDNPETMTSVQAKELLGVPLPRIHRWTARGMLRPVGKDGNRPTYLTADLAALNNRANVDPRGKVA